MCIRDSFTADAGRSDRHAFRSVVASGNDNNDAAVPGGVDTPVSYTHLSISFENGKTYRVRNLKEKIVGSGIDVASVFSSYFIVLPDMEAVEEIYQIQADIYGENRSEIRSYYGFDLSCDEAVQIEMRDAFYSEFIGAVDAENSGIYVNVECAAAERRCV